MRPLILFLLAASPLPARKSLSPKVLGWSADGLKLAYVAPPEEVGEGELGGTGTVTYGVMIDGRTGLTDKYLLASDGEIPPEDAKELRILPGKKEWQAATQGLKCEEGAADVTVKGKGVSGRWKKNLFVFDYSGDEFAEEKKAIFTMAPKGKGPSATWTTSSPMAGAGAGLSGQIRACFGGKRVAWIVERSSGMMRDPGDYGVVIGPNGGPRIQLVADVALLRRAAEKVGAALEAAGIVSTASKQSNEKTPRTATVVYAAPGFEAEAQKVAKAVPGGATVDKLDWKAPFEIVVGIGASALK